jgi:hypothetical protein
MVYLTQTNYNWGGVQCIINGMMHERFLRLTERPHQKQDDKDIHDGTYI